MPRLGRRRQGLAGRSLVVGCGACRQARGDLALAVVEATPCWHAPCLAVALEPQGHVPCGAPCLTHGTQAAQLSCRCACTVGAA